MNDDKPSGQQVVTQNNDPWSGVQPHLTQGFDKAEELILNKPTEYFPDSTVVPFSTQTTQGLDMMANRAAAGNAGLNAANNNIAATAGGAFLNSNPYLQGAIDSASDGIVRNYQKAVTPGIDSRFSASGRYGSGMHKSAHDDAQNILADQLSDVAGNMSFGNYNNERTHMMGAAQMAPQLAQADYMDADRMLTAGQIQEGQMGAELQDDINRFYHDQGKDKQALADYMALVAGGQFGGTSTQTQPIYSNKLQQGLGTAATLAGIGSSLFGTGFLR